ncbi:putative lysosomal/endosomal membrane protein [Trypanosoma vivax]|nr:putative lysosomal/endosomal membrane protein [Trypanosoma vivax]
MKMHPAMRNLLLLVFVCLNLSVQAQAFALWSDQADTVYVRYSFENKTFSVADDPKYGTVVGLVSLKASFNETGWDVLSGSADSAFLQQHASNLTDVMPLIYGAIGFGEGYLTHNKTYDAVRNVFEGKGGLDELLEKSKETVRWLDEHLRYMENYPAEDDFGRQLKNMLALLDGLVSGHNSVMPKGKRLDRVRLFYYNMMTEIGDIVRAVSPHDVVERLKKEMPRWFKDQHCSALVKMTANDIFFAHSTWSSFNSMLRQYKSYRFGKDAVVMSSYPGLVHSVDDWYMTHNRLAVMETTNMVYDDALLRTGVVNRSVAAFMRAMIANVIAKDAPSWVGNFSRENSGTYNNQWMVLDMGKVNQGVIANRTLPADTFWVAEQLPGKESPLGVTAQDMTAHLNNKTYWASYNIPFFPNVYNLSGTLSQKNKFGDFFSYENYSRALIFARDQGNVTDLEGVKRLIRYNNFKVDPFSRIPNCTGAGGGKPPANKCNPEYSAMLAIAARGDLNPPGGPSQYGPLYGSVGRRDHGATDAKIATWSGMSSSHKFVAHAVCGPTTDQQPPFEWKKDMFDPMPPTYGLLNVYNFSFVSFTTQIDDSWDDNAKIIAAAVGATASVLVLIVIAVVILRSRKVETEDELQEEQEALLE